MTFGSALEAEITHRGWTQREAAEVIGIPQSRLNDILLGKRDAGWGTGIKIIRRFPVLLAWFITEIFRSD